MTFPKHRAGLAFMGLFALYAFVSIGWTVDPFWPSIQLLSLGVAYAIGYFVRNLEKLWLWVLYALVVCIPASLFVNANIVGTAFALGIAAAIGYKLWWFIGYGLLGHLVAQSRGAILATGATLVVVLWQRSKLLALGVFTSAMAAITAIGFGRVDTGYKRLGIWQDTLNHLTPFGHGFNSFYTAYGKWPVLTNMTTDRPLHVYNDYLELLFDFGIGSCLLWIAITLAYDGADSAQQLILLTFAVASLTFFPLYVFPLGQVFACTLGHMARK